MSIPVALQLYSVRDAMSTDMESTLRQVRAAGYDGVEFAGLFNRTPEEVRDLCQEIGLVPVSAHVPYYDMIADPEKVLADYARIGCKYVAIPYLTPECRPGTDGFSAVIENARKLGSVAGSLGMELLYHNHDFEFVKLNGKYALDVLYESVEPSLLKTELDTCWVSVGGERPDGFIRKYHGRTPIVHLKDYVGQKTEHMYELIGIQSSGKSAEAFGFRSVGSGVLDFKAITRAAEESGAKWFVVEQDNPTPGKSPMECAVLSREYLKTIGY